MREMLFVVFFRVSMNVVTDTDKIVFQFVD